MKSCLGEGSNVAKIREMDALFTENNATSLGGLKSVDSRPQAKPS